MLILGAKTNFIPSCQAATEFSKKDEFQASHPSILLYGLGSPRLTK